MADPGDAYTTIRGPGAGSGFFMQFGDLRRVPERPDVCLKAGLGAEIGDAILWAGRGVGRKCTYIRGSSPGGPAQVELVGNPPKTAGDGAPSA
jgi:hypothetical protein